MDLQLTDDPIWLYFDSHHKQIIDEMNRAYQAAVRSIEGMTQRANVSHKVSHIHDTAIIQKTNPDASDPVALTASLAAQLQTAILGLEAKESDAAVGTHSLLLRPKRVEP